MKIRKMKSNLDERQELKLLKIEHNGCWIAFWGLLIVMAIQMIVGNDSIKNLAGEWAVFMSLAFFLRVAFGKTVKIAAVLIIHADDISAFFVIGRREDPCFPFSERDPLVFEKPAYRGIGVVSDFFISRRTG